jgi:hypothetical protein
MNNNWGDDIKKLSTSSNNPSKMEIELTQNIFSNGKQSFYESPHLRVALISSLLFLFLNLNIVNDSINKITKKDSITKVILTVFFFLIVYASSYYHNE